MTAGTPKSFHPSPPLKRPPLIPNAVFGMGLFVFTEVMLFSGMISGFIVIKSSNPYWSIPANIQLPVLTTAFNTGVLFLSGIALFLAGRYLSKNKQDTACHYLLIAALLGVVFVSIQGYEWIELLGFGLSMESNIFGGLFFMIIGLHGIHALLGSIMLLWYALVRKGRFAKDSVTALQVFWFFVVGIWPFLYRLVYFH